MLENTTLYWRVLGLSDGMRHDIKNPYAYLRHFSLFSALSLTLIACGNSPNLIAITPGRGRDRPEIALGEGQDSGVSATDKYTNKSQPLLDVKGPLNSDIAIKNKTTGTLIAEGDTDNSGEISLQPFAPLDDGVYTLVASSDNGNNEGSEFTLTIDSSAEKPVIDEREEGNFQQDALINDSEKNSFSLSGTKIEEDAEFVLYASKNDGDEKIFNIPASDLMLADQSASSPSSYNWQISNVLFEDLALEHGDQLTISVEQRDKAGNVSEKSDAVTFTTDFVPPMLATDKPVSFTIDDDRVSIVFDEEIRGTISGTDIKINGSSGEGSGLMVSSGTPVLNSEDTLIFFLVSPLSEGSVITSVAYTGSSLTDVAGNRVEEFTATKDQIDIVSSDDNQTGSGTETPTNLVFTVNRDGPDTQIIPDTVDTTVFLTNDNTPVFSLVGDMLNGSNIMLYFGDKPVDTNDDLLAEKILQVGNQTDFKWADDDIVRDKLEDGTYTFFAITMNENPTDGETETYTLIIDTTGPSVIADPSGFIRTSISSFEVRFNEEAFYGETRQKSIGDIESKLKLLDSFDNPLFSGDFVQSVMLIEEDPEQQTFTGFTFEIDPTPNNIESLKTDPFVRLALERGTVEDRLGNTNDNLTGNSIYRDFTPPKGEISGYNTNTLRIRFDKGAELITNLTPDLFKVIDASGIEYTVDGTPTYDPDKGILSIVTMEDVVNKEITVTIPAKTFKSPDLNWDNENIEHQVFADLRLPNPPSIRLREVDDTGPSSFDNITNNPNARIDFILKPEDKGGLLEIEIIGTLRNGTAYSHTRSKEVARGESYTLEGLNLPEGRYEIEATILDDFGQKSNKGYFSLPENAYGYALSGEHADLFTVTNAGVLHFKDKSSSIGSAYNVTVTYRDANGDTIFQDVVINVVTASQDDTGNEIPVFDANLARTIRFESGSTDNIGKFPANDTDTGDTLTYRVEGNDASKFTIDGDGRLSFIQPPDINVGDSTRGNNDYQLTIIASDGKNEAFHDLEVEVTAEMETNADPLFHANAGVMDVVAGQKYIGEFFGEDTDNDKLFYSIGGQDSHLFIIDEGGVLYFRETPIEKDKVYNFSVTVSDGISTFFGKTESVTVKDQNFTGKPSFLANLSIVSAFPGASQGDVVGTFDASGGSGSLMYELLGADKALFSIDNNGEVTFSQSVPYMPTTRSRADDNTYYFTVRVFDDNGVDALLPQRIEINTSNDAPNFVGLNQDYDVLGGNDKVTVLDAKDSNGDVLTFTVKGADANQFVIVDDTLRLTPNLDFDAGGQNTYNINIIVSDGMGGEALEMVSVNILENNVAGNTRPEFLPNTATIIYTNDENVDNFGATDADGDNIALTLASSADSALFDISPAGTLTFKNTPDYENPQDGDANNVYEVTIIASDGHAEILHDVLVYVENTPEMDRNWVDNVDVEKGKSYVGSFLLMDAGDEPKLLVDTTPPSLVAVIPVFSFIGNSRLIVQFNEDITISGRLDYSDFVIQEAGDDAPTFDFSMPGQLFDSNSIELFLTSEFKGDSFRLLYNGSFIEDVAGNKLPRFDAKGEVLGKPDIRSTKWDDAGTNTILSDDTVSFTFNNDVRWELPLADVLANGAITWIDNDNPGIAGTVDATNYSVDLTDDVLSITFMGADLPESDDIAFTFESGILSLNIAGLDLSANTNSELVASVDTKAPIAPVLKSPTSTGLYQDIATDSYINIAEQSGAGFQITGTASDRSAMLNVRIGGEIISGAITNVPDDWEYRVDLQDILMNVVDGDMLTVFLSDDSGNESPDSSNSITYTLDIEKPKLRPGDARALEGSNFIVIDLDDDLLTNSIDSSQFSIRVNGVDFMADDVVVSSMSIEIDVDSMVSFQANDTISVAFLPSTSEGNAVYDKAGNPLDAFDNKTATITNAPVITALSVENGTNPGERNIVLMFNGTIEPFTGTTLDSSDVILDGNKLASDPTIINGDQIVIMLDANEVSALSTLDKIELTLRTNTLQLVGETDGNFEDTEIFDLKPPSGIMIDLISDTGVSTTDNYTSTITDVMFSLELGDDASDLEQARVEVYDPVLMSRVGNLVDVTRNSNFVFDLDLMSSGSTVSRPYLLRVVEATDIYGNVSTTPDPDLDIFVDDTVAFIQGDSVDFGGSFQGGVHYLLPNDPDTDRELTVRVYFEEEDQELQFYYRFAEVDGPPPSWGSVPDIDDLKFVDQGLDANNFSSGTTTISGQQVSFAEFNIINETGRFSDTSNDLNLETYFQFVIVDKAGNVATRTETTEIASDLNLSLSINSNIANGSDTGISDKDLITQGGVISGTADRSVNYYFLDGMTTWSGVDQIKVIATKYDLNTGGLEPNTFFSATYDSTNGFTNNPQNRSVDVIYQNAENAYFIVEQEFSLVSSSFGEAPVGQRTTQTLVLDDIDPIFREAAFITNNTNGPYTVNNILLFTSTDSDDFVNIENSFYGKTGDEDYLNIFGDGGEVSILLNGVQSNVDLIQLSFDSSNNRTVEGGINIRIEGQGIKLQNGDTVTITFKESFTTQENYIQDVAGNRVSGSFAVTFDASKTLESSASFFPSGGRQFTDDATKNQYIVDVTPTVAPFIAEEGFEPEIIGSPFSFSQNEGF